MDKATLLIYRQQLALAMNESKEMMNFFLSENMGDRNQPLEKPQAFFTSAIGLNK